MLALHHSVTYAVPLSVTASLLLRRVVWSFAPVMSPVIHCVALTEDQCHAHMPCKQTAICIVHSIAASILMASSTRSVTKTLPPTSPALFHCLCTLDCSFVMVPCMVMQRGQVRSLDEVLANISSQAAQVVDARGAGRFQGTAPEPRPGVRGGHIPHSMNVPFDAVLHNSR